MPWVGFEPTISAGERPKTYALDRVATGIGTIGLCPGNYLQDTGLIKKSIIAREPLLHRADNKSSASKSVQHSPPVLNTLTKTLKIETVTFVLYIINRLVFITEVESVYCAVRTKSL